MLYRSFRISSVKTCFFRFMFNYNQKRCYSYEGDGKTTVSFLTRETDDQLLVTAFNKLGFRLNSGVFVVGPVVLFPKTVLSWNVAGDDDINEDSLSLFCNLEPKIDVLVIGLGDDNSFKNQKSLFDKFNALKEMKLNFELLTTEKAIATYNFLCIENRFVAGALIPPLKDIVKPQDPFFLNFHEVLKKGKDDYFLGTDSAEVEKLEREKATAPHHLLPTPEKSQSFRGFFQKTLNKGKEKKDE